MKTLAALIIAASLPVHAGPGFFRQQEEHITKPVAKADAFQCALVTNYNAATPTAITLAFIGFGCLDSMLDAITAAQPKAAPIVGGEPANPPIYQCTVMVMWNPVSSSSPSIGSSGTGCDATHATALSAARRTVQCQLGLGGCGL